MSVSTLRKSNTLDKLLSQVQAENAPQEKKSYVDERLWKPELDKSGTGSAVIRFLPAPDGEELPWVKVFKHAFQGPTGKWYIENSLTTIGKNDPVSEHNSALWNTGLETDKETARKQKRKLEYYSNIYVVSDPKHPENNGKVFLFRYGKKIFDKIMAAMQPEFEDETPINPFDFWEGANFKLKLRKVDGYWNYDKSEFEAPSALFDDDDKLEELWGKEHSLTAFTDNTNFKSYDELKKRLDVVLSGVTTVGNVTEMTTSESFDDSPETLSVVDTPEEPAPTVSVTEEDDDTMSYFEKLAEEN